MMKFRMFPMEIMLYRILLVYEFGNDSMGVNRLVNVLENSHMFLNKIVFMVISTVLKVNFIGIQVISLGWIRLVPSEEEVTAIMLRFSKSKSSKEHSQKIFNYYI